MTTLDMFLDSSIEERETLLQAQKRRKAEMEALRPKQIPEDMLLMDWDMFVATYRSRYGNLTPRAIDWRAWNKAERQRDRRRERQ